MSKSVASWIEALSALKYFFIKLHSRKKRTDKHETYLMLCIRIAHKERVELSFPLPILRICAAVIYTKGHGRNGLAFRTLDVQNTKRIYSKSSRSNILNLQQQYTHSTTQSTPKLQTVSKGNCHHCILWTILRRNTR